MIKGYRSGGKHTELDAKKNWVKRLSKEQLEEYNKKRAEEKRIQKEAAEYSQVVQTKVKPKFSLFNTATDWTNQVTKFTSKALVGGVTAGLTAGMNLLGTEEDQEIIDCEPLS